MAMEEVDFSRVILVDGISIMNVDTYCLRFVEAIEHLSKLDFNLVQH